MIEIHKSETADSRTSDIDKVTKDQLIDSTESHINDVIALTKYVSDKLIENAEKHDADKLSDIDSFYKTFKGGFKDQKWINRHYKLNRHHLTKHVPEDVTLLDVIEYIIDSTVAGMARSGSVYPIEISNEVLDKAFRNTCENIKNSIKVIE